MLYAQERRGAKDYQIYHQCYQVHMIHPLKTVKILTYSKFHFPCLKFFPLNLPCQEYIFSFLLWIVLVIYHDPKAEYSPPIIFTVIWNYVELTKRISTPVLAVQQQEVWRVCFLEGFLLGLEWVLAHLLFLSMWQRYENWFFFFFYTISWHCSLQLLVSDCALSSWAGFTHVCKGYLWELHSDCNMYWAYWCPIDWNPCKGNWWLVRNILELKWSS